MFSPFTDRRLLGLLATARRRDQVAVGLARTTSGLLARYEHDDASYPFAVNDWTTTGDLTLSLEGGSLKVQQTVGSASRFAWVLEDRAEGFVQAVIQGHTVGTNANAQSGPRVGAGAAWFSIKRSAGEQCAITEGSELDSAGISSRTTGIDYRMSYSVDAVDRRAHDHLSGQDLLADGPSSESVLGLRFFCATANTIWLIRRFFAMPSCLVTVTGVPAGGSVDIRTIGGALVATAAESGGTATPNLFAAEATWPGPAVVQVRDSGGALLAKLTPTAPSGVWGGDTYAYA